jgi:nitrate reductase gamma subunit
MNVRYIYSLIAVIVLILLAYAGAEAGIWSQYILGIIIPYLALLVFVVFFIRRMLGWARSAVPFRIPTTCGQQKTLPWFKPARLDNPSSRFGVIGRMFLEIVFFRSLFRNTKFMVKEQDKPFYALELWLWVGALAFHLAFFTVLARHLRFFTQPVPLPISLLEKIDSFFQVGLPVVFLSGIVLFAAVTYLLIRRVLISQVRYISLASDYFPLFLIFAIAFSGILMRYFAKVDVVGVKEMAMGLVTFHPHIVVGVGSIFYVHLFLVSIVIAYFPFSKLMHLGGIFLSPTRNMANNTRAVRHINPWNYPVEVHTYEEYEEEFRDKMIEAGLPVEKE